MKKTNLKIILFAVLMMFIAACVPLKSTQHITNLTQPKAAEKLPDVKKTNISSTVSKNTTKLISKNSTAAKTNETKKIKKLFASNVSLTKEFIGKRTTKGVTYTIELLDVASDSSGCLINVDDTTSFIVEGNTATFGGLKIYVAEVHILHNQLEDSDVCEVVISGT